MSTHTGKLVVLGDQGVGKTSIVRRSIEQSFSSYISPTIGASYFSCRIKIDESLVQLDIWDTAGQERFRAMVPIFYRKANSALLVYEINRLESFENVKYWAQELKGKIQQPIVLVVVGNKTDLADDRVIPQAEALQYANSIGAEYFECSAKDNQGMEQIFLSLAQGIIRLQEATNERSLRYEGNVDSPGRIEMPGYNTGAIAHANEVRPSKCC